MVNTFYIDPNPKVTARILDDKRLGKQRVEAFQIIQALEGKTKGWKNHPAAKSWKGYETALKLYYNIMVKEWVRRGKENNMKLYKLPHKDEIKFPYWTTCQKVLDSHKARLIQKEPTYYLDKLETSKKSLKYGYIWPAKWTNEELDTLSVKELSEPFKLEIICDAFYKNGKKCVSKGLYGGKCKKHMDPEYEPELCSAKLKSGKSCHFKAKENGLCGVHMKSD
jgi:hypothetical protein